MTRTPEIEEATLDDLPGAVDLMNVVYDDGVVTVHGWRHRIESQPERAQQRLFKAVAGGEVVGWCSGRLDTHTTTPGVAFVGSTVHPSHRGQGLGATLLETCEAHVLGLGATMLRGGSQDEEPARRLAARHGYRHTFTSRISMLDPRTLPDVPEPPAGVELLPFSAFDDPAPIHHVDVTAALDEPGDDTWDHMPLDEWTREFWEDPTLDRDVCMTAVVDGEVVALTMVDVDPATGRAENSMTGTLPEFRGRGLAKLVKHASLRRLAELGVTKVFTQNDETNAPMLAVNTALGYRPYSARLSWVRDAT